MTFIVHGLSYRLKVSHLVVCSAFILGRLNFMVEIYSRVFFRLLFFFFSYYLLYLNIPIRMCASRNNRNKIECVI